jgi:hypothetical protein
LQRLYAFNQSLPSARRIQHHFTDGAVDWPNLTQEKMAAHWRSLGHRDEQMARVIIAEMERLDRAGGKRAKSLVIMNFRHAFDLTGGAGQAPRYNTCEFLRDALPGRVANVRINEDLFWPVAGGRWNAAFEQTGNRPTGFDLAGTPFGKEPFDLFPWNPSIRGRLKYQDVFTGFVFVNAARAQYFLEGVPGYYRGWEEEMRRRARLFGSDYVKMVDQEIVREKQGRVPVKSPHVVFSIASWVETALASLFAFGFIIGCTSFGFRNRVNAPVPAPKAEPNRVSVGATLPSAAGQRSPRLWFAFIAAIVASLFVHEVGHCAVAWLHGCPAIPTPAKEYLLKPLPTAAQNEVALGGILGSVAALVGALYWLYRKPGPLRSALVAGAMTMPGFYGLRFFLAGRGHDATEFQDAQAALGLSYSGHALDWLFIGLFTLAAAVWFWRARPSIGFRLARRLLLGSVTALAVVVLLQLGNNALFDPLFQR